MEIFNISEFVCNDNEEHKHHTAKVIHAQFEETAKELRLLRKEIQKINKKMVKMEERMERITKKLN